MASEPYKIERRTTHKSNGTPLSGYAMDITIRANAQGAYFLQDHNGHRNTMPHNDLSELFVTLMSEIVRNDREHFKQA